MRPSSKRSGDDLMQRCLYGRYFLLVTNGSGGIANRFGNRGSFRKELTKKPLVW